VPGTALTTSLRLETIPGSPTGRVGGANDGYWGIPVRPQTAYHASFYARASPDFKGPLNVDIESNDGATVFARGSVGSVSHDWKLYSLTLNTGDAAPSTSNRFVLSTSGPGTLWLAQVSLFPPTYNNRPNGNRVDLMQKLADLKPTFLRLPGGN